MEPAHKVLDPDPRPRTLILSLPNGVLKKHNQHQHQQRTVVAVYRECLRNHAASLGGHSLDGCGEFMASPSSNPSDPTSLVCAACGCHRNFHRRLHHSPPPPPPPLPPPLPQPQPQPQHHRLEREAVDDEEDDLEDERQFGDEDDDAANGETDENNNNSSAPHMLMALSAGGVPAPQPVAAAAAAQIQAASGGTSSQQQQPSSSSSRKRFRTRFSPEQKERMHELSERLGWRMQKRDEGLVEESCREIGVGRGVFKVWMHNNKHNFVPSPRSSSAPTPLAIPTISAMSTLSSAAAAGGDGIISGTNTRLNGGGGSDHSAAP